MAYIGNSPEFWNLNVNKYSYTANEGQTTFNAVYDDVVDVYLNGSKLQDGVDFTATSGVTIVLTVAATAGDVVDIAGYFNIENFDISNYDGVGSGLDADLLDGQHGSYYAPLANPLFTGTPVINSYPAISIQHQDVFNKEQKNSSLFTKQDASTITIPTNTAISVGNTVSITSSVSLSLNTDLDTGTKVAGTDYYVYALDTDTFIISANASYPSGYSASNSRKIGGFHYGLIPESFTAINNITTADATAIAGINQYSFWDLKFKPVSNPEGMILIGNKWYDIYLLNSEHIVNGTSKAGATIAAGGTDYGRAIPKVPLAYGGNGTTTYGSFTWYEACEIGNAYGKQLISYEEFSGIAYGVQENASWGNTSATIQHVANHTSKFGVCQATGVQWIWGSNLMNGYGTTDLAWRSNTESRGQIYSTSNSPTAAILGGDWFGGSQSGSRCSGWYRAVSNTYWNLGCRFACDHLMLV